MNFRIKSKHWAFDERVASNYDPELPVLPGSQAWTKRIAVNDFYRAGQLQEYAEAKEDLFASLKKKGESNKKNGSTVLSLELRHGDMVVMHGERMQEVVEVCTHLIPTIF